MDERHETPSAADLAAEAGALSTGLGIVTMQFFPFALPLLLLVVAPLAVLALAGAVLALPVVFAVWLARRAMRTLRRGRSGSPRQDAADPVVKMVRLPG
jgi:hypothetical protein